MFKKIKWFFFYKKTLNKNRDILLEKHNITCDCRVNARAIYAGDKWKVTEIEKI